MFNYKLSNVLCRFLQLFIFSSSISICVSYYDNYKLRWMLGVSKVMTLDEYIGW